MDVVVLHPFPIESEWQELEDEFLPCLSDLELDFEVEVQPQALVADATEYLFDLIVSVPWRELPGSFANVLGLLVLWQSERARRRDGEPTLKPYRIKVLYSPDGSVLTEVEVRPAPE